MGAAGGRFSHCRSFISCIDGICLLLTISANNNMITYSVNGRSATMPIYRHMCNFSLLIHFLAMISLCQHGIYTYSLLKSVQESSSLCRNLVLKCYKIRYTQNPVQGNITFSFFFLFFLLLGSVFYYCVLVKFIPIPSFVGKFLKR